MRKCQHRLKARLCKSCESDGLSGSLFVAFVDFTFDLINFQSTCVSVKKFHVNCIIVHYMLCYD